MNINKKKIVKYVSAGILATTLISGISIGIYDTNIDHTKQLCPISSLPLIGNLHQAKSMVSDLHDQGYQIVTCSFDTTEENPLHVESISAYYDYKPLDGLEDGMNVLNNYAQKVTLKK